MGDTRSPQVAAHVVASASTLGGSRTSMMAAMVVFSGEPIPLYSRSPQLFAHLVLAQETLEGSRTAQELAHVVYGENYREQFNARAWGFELDGHIFYVLHLGTDATMVYDRTSNQWYQWETAGFPIWNAEVGWTWDTDQILAGQNDGPLVVKIDPNTELDDGFRTMLRVVTGITTARGRDKTFDIAALRLVASPDAEFADNPILELRWSDDQGVTWTDWTPFELTEGDIGRDIEWRGLGSFGQPGRVWEIQDIGGLLRISDATLEVDGEDA